MSPPPPTDAGSTIPTVSRWSLLEDGSLEIFVEDELRDAAGDWIPRMRPPSLARPGASDSRGAQVHLRLARGSLSRGDADAAPDLRLGSVSAWIDGDRATVRDAGGRCGGEVDLAGLRARLEARADARNDLSLFTLLTISAAMLLSRMARALLHAAAVVGPGGGAWLLVGDAHAGKTTTTLNLLRAGWGYLSDDHVVLQVDPGSGEVTVEGWPRDFHVDEGWVRGQPTGVRLSVPAPTVDAVGWTRRAPLRGLIFPRVEAGEATSLAPTSAADALARLIRQSPWFVADREATPAVFALLQRCVNAPAHDLRLGLDSFADPGRLLAILDPALTP